MTAKILQHPNLPLTHLNLNSLRYAGEDFEQKLLNAISSMARPTLLYLNLGSNSDWWNDLSELYDVDHEMNFSLLLKILENQKHLKELDLSDSEFFEKTERLFKTIIEAKMFDSLSTLNLRRSVDFHSDNCVSYFA